MDDNDNNHATATAAATTTDDDEQQQQQQQHLSQQRRLNFRSSTYATYSSDRTTIEDMADQVISRVIDTAAICVQNSLGFTFLHHSGEQLTETEDDDNKNMAQPVNPTREQKSLDAEEAEEDVDTFTGTEGMTFPVSRRQQLAACGKQLSRSGSLSGNQPPIVLEEEEYPLVEGFNKTKGTDFIDRVVQTWELPNDAWSWRIDFLRIQPSPNRSLYIYNAIFTPKNASERAKKKIQVTAQVEFNITVNHLEAEAGSRVGVEFRLEGQRFRHAPGQFRFRECWLQNIIDKKQKLIRQITL